MSREQQGAPDTGAVPDTGAPGAGGAEEGAESVVEQSSESEEEAGENGAALVSDSEVDSWDEPSSDKKRRLDEWWEQLSDRGDESDDEDGGGALRRQEPHHTSTLKGDAKHAFETDREKRDREDKLERTAKDEEQNKLILKFRGLCGKTEIDQRWLRGHGRNAGGGRPSMPRRYVGGPGCYYNSLEQAAIDFLKKLSPAELNTVTKISGSFLHVAARYNRPRVCLFLLGNPLFQQRRAVSSTGCILAEALFADIGYSFSDQRGEDLGRHYVAEDVLEQVFFQCPDLLAEHLNGVFAQPPNSFENDQPIIGQVLRECYRRDHDFQFLLEVRLQPGPLLNGFGDCSTFCAYQIFRVAERLLANPGLQLGLPRKNSSLSGYGCHDAGWFRTRSLKIIRGDCHPCPYEDLARAILHAPGESRNRRKNTVARYLQASEGQKCRPDQRIHPTLLPLLRQYAWGNEAKGFLSSRSGIGKLPRRATKRVWAFLGRRDEFRTVCRFVAAQESVARALNPDVARLIFELVGSGASTKTRGAAKHVEDSGEPDQFAAWCYEQNFGKKRAQERSAERAESSRSDEERDTDEYKDARALVVERLRKEKGVMAAPVSSGHEAESYNKDGQGSSGK